MRSVLAGFLALVWLGCGPSSEPLEPGAGRVVFVGVDGAAWRVIDPMLRKGELPHFASLVERGCRGSLKSLYPSWSPVIWTSIATGVPVREHGIKDFTHKKEGLRHLFTSDMVKVARIWDLASRGGKRASC